MLYMYYAAQDKYRIKTPVFLILLSSCFLGNMFYGRSGMVVSILCILVATLIWNRRHLIRIFRFALAGFVLFLCVYSLRNLQLFSTWYTWMSTPIINLITTGSFNNASFSSTAYDMIWIPSTNTFLLGDGWFMQNGHYYMRTDSGIMRNILFWGLLGAMVSYGATFLSLKTLREKNILLWILMVVSFFAFEFKGDVYYEYITITMVFSLMQNLVFSRYGCKRKSSEETTVILDWIGYSN